MIKEKTFIITDDDEGHRILIKRSLRRIGINNIITFNNGEEVLDFVRNSINEKEDEYIILLDLRMPKIDGFEVLRELKQTPRLKNIPVVIISTTEDPDEVDMCHEIGCDYYLKKPIEIENFVKAFDTIGAI